MIVDWAESAQRDLREHIYCLSRRSSAAARRMRTAVVEAVERLAEFPHRGRPGRAPGTRELVMSGLPYLVVYMVEGESVTVLRVLHAAQDWPLPDAGNAVE